MIVSEIEMNMKEALKDGRMEDKNDYSYLLSRFRAKEVEHRGELTDDEAIDVIRKEVKQMQKDYDAMSGDLLNTHYAKGLKRQIDLYSIYLPKMMSYDEVLDYLRGMDAECMLPTAFGAAMKVVRAEIGTKADGKTISQALKDYITQEKN